MANKLYFLYDFVFPNMVLPNALITEYGIMSYLYSLHASKLNQHPANIIEKISGFNDQSIGGAVLDNGYGNQPNSQTGSHMASPFYNEFFEYLESSLFEGRKLTERYIYPIRVTPYINDFTGISHTGSKINGEYFWKHMSIQALTDAQEGRAIIFLDYAQENFVDKSTYVKLHESLSLSGIPKNNIIMAFNSYNAKEVYESWFTEDERRIQVRNWPFVTTNTSFSYCMNSHQRMSIDEFKETKNNIRNKHFIFKTRRPREYRVALLYKMATDNLLDKADWSCLTPLKYNELDISMKQNKYQFEFNSDAIRNLCANTPHTLDGEIGSTYDTVSAWTDQTPDSHKNAYLYFCTETYTTGEYKSLTEKIFKPIVNFQPFLFMAYPGALELLKKLGFKTFSPMIDESYDNELDEAKRLHMIYAELNRLCSMSKEEIHNWYWGMEEILIHNYNHFLNIWKRESNANELITYLIARTKL